MQLAKSAAFPLSPSISAVLFSVQGFKEFLHMGYMGKTFISLQMLHHITNFLILNQYLFTFKYMMDLY